MLLNGHLITSKHGSSRGTVFLPISRPDRPTPAAGELPSRRSREARGATSIVILQISIWFLIPHSVETGLGMFGDKIQFVRVCRVVVLITWLEIRVLSRTRK